VLKDAAYTVLGKMICAVRVQPPAGTQDGASRLSVRIGALLDEQIGLLRARMQETVQETAASLPAGHARMLYREHERWQAASGWQLINAADPCGT
jgi:hypothetical protein